MKAFIKKIEKNFWFYIAWLLLAVIVWDWIFGLLTRLKPIEKVSVFIGCYSETFEREEELNESRPAYLKGLEFNVFPNDEIYFSIRLEYHGLEEGDILILSESRAKDYYAQYFSPISEKYQTEISNLGFYTDEDGTVYGLKVYDKETKESLISCLDFVKSSGEDEEAQTDSALDSTEENTDEEENFYLFFNKNSLHLSDLAEEEKVSERNGAITVAQRIVSL